MDMYLSRSLSVGRSEMLNKLLTLDSLVCGYVEVDSVFTVELVIAFWCYDSG